MATILQVLNNFKALNLMEVSANTIYELRENIYDLNREQLIRGLDKFGKKFYEYKSEQYADYKYSKNTLAGYGNADGKDTGAFYDEITLRFLNKSTYLIYSQDEKYKKLTSPKMFGADIFGLMSSSKEKLIDNNLQSKLVENVKKVVRL